ALAFHREGARLILSARRSTELECVKAACGRTDGDILVLPFDMLDEAARAVAVRKALAHFGQIDILVNNAGLSQRSLGKDTLPSVDRTLMELNFFAVVGLTKLVLPS